MLANFQIQYPHYNGEGRGGGRNHMVFPLLTLNKWIPPGLWGLNFIWLSTFKKNVFPSSVCPNEAYNVCFMEDLYDSKDDDFMF